MLQNYFFRQCFFSKKKSYGKIIHLNYLKIMEQIKIETLSIVKLNVGNKI